MLELLGGCQLFKGLSLHEKEEYLSKFPYQIKKFKKGDPIVFANEAVIQQLILAEGEVKSEMTDYNGKTIKMADMKAPRLLAPGFLFGQGNLYPVSIIASSKQCKIIGINKSHFIETLLKYPKLQINFLDIISNQTQFLTRKINFLNFKTIKGKIAHFLLKQSMFTGQNIIKLQQSQTQLADLFGVTRPSLSRAFNELKHDNMIHMDGKKIIIKDLKALETFLE